MAQLSADCVSGNVKVESSVARLQANFPDVMMEAYNTSRYFGIFFIGFVCVNIYLLQNLILAVIFNQVRCPTTSVCLCAN